MLEARSVAVVGASPRAGSFGARMLTELARSPSRPKVYPVNPRYGGPGGNTAGFAASLAELPDAVDLVLLGVRDALLPEQLQAAADRGDRGAVIFGGAHGDGLRTRLAEIARDAGMALCGGGCMGFVNVVAGVRAVGYLEPDPIPAGPVALVTHSGSIFSALLRTRRRIGYTLAVSSGQELVTATADYLDYALDLPGTRVVALVLETLRDPEAFRRALATAMERDVAVVALTVGGSPGGRALVAAHSGAIAGDDAGWEALFDAYGVHRVGDLAELTDTLELLSADRRAGRGGIATVHDSGAERAHAADLAHALRVPYAPLAGSTLDRLAGLLDPGLTPGNPLDVWGTGADTRSLFAGSMSALLADPGVAALALCVDLVPEFDGDDSYPHAVLDVAAGTGKPIAVLSNLGCAIDPVAAARLRDAGVPVLEGTRSGLLALRHLIARAEPGRPPGPHVPDAARRERWAARLAAGPFGLVEALALLADYGIPVAATRAVASRDEAVAAADVLGYPAVLKTDGVAHRSDVGGVVLGLPDAAAVARAYDDLARRLGPAVTVSATAPGGVELALGIAGDPRLGPLVLVAAGGVLVELLTDRAVRLPPLDRDGARRMLDRLAVRPLLDGVRGGPAVDVEAVTAALIAVSVLAAELGDLIAALDVNPLICGPDGPVAVDALVVPI